MNCRCNFLSPFAWRTHPRPSIFMADSAFFKGASTGQTMASIQTQAMHRFEMENGRSAGTIFGFSGKTDRATEESIRQRRQRAASHYRGKA